MSSNHCILYSIHIYTYTHMFIYIHNIAFLWPLVQYFISPSALPLVWKVIVVLPSTQKSLYRLFRLNGPHSLRIMPCCLKIFRLLKKDIFHESCHSISFTPPYIKEILPCGMNESIWIIDFGDNKLGSRVRHTPRRVQVRKARHHFTN